MQNPNQSMSQYGHDGFRQPQGQLVAVNPQRQTQSIPAPRQEIQGDEAIPEVPTGPRRQRDADKFAKANPQETAQEAYLKRLFWKTTPCNFWKEGCCKKGKDCSYAHGDVERRIRPDLTKTTLCKNWMTRSCRHSAKTCKFAHGFTELQDNSMQMTHRNSGDQGVQNAYPQPVQFSKAAPEETNAYSCRGRYVKQPFLAPGMQVQAVATPVVWENNGQACGNWNMTDSEAAHKANILTQEAIEVSKHVIQALFEMAAPDHYED